MSCRASALARATATAKPKATRRQMARPMILHLLPSQRRLLMFDKIGDAAAKVATNVARRAFLGRLGQGALGLAAVIGGVLAFSEQAKAAGGQCCVGGGGYGGCFYYSFKTNRRCACGGARVDCNRVPPGCQLVI